MIVISGITISNPLDTVNSVTFQILDNSLNVLKTIPYTGQTTIYYQELSAGTYHIKINDGTSTETCEVTHNLIVSGSCFSFGVTNYSVYSIIQDSDNNYLIGGEFSKYDGESFGNIIKVDANGVIDDSFNTGGTGSSLGVAVVYENSAGKYLIGGQFKSYNGEVHNRIIALNRDGSIYDGISFGTGFNNYNVYTIYEDSDGKYLIGGQFTSYNGTNVNHLVRLHPDGSIDTSFNSGNTGFNHIVKKVIQDSNGGYIVGGNFGGYNDVQASGILRLFNDGTLDTSFTVSGDIVVQDIIIDSSGKYVICGSFTSYSGITAMNIARLNTNGSLDDTFYCSGTGPTGGVSGGGLYSICQDVDGKYVIGGFFHNYNGNSANNIARLNNDGTFDDTFNYNGEVAGVSKVCAIENKKYLVGFFRLYPTPISYNLIRLKNNGNVDIC